MHTIRHAWQGHRDRTAIVDATLGKPYDREQNAQHEPRSDVEDHRHQGWDVSHQHACDVAGHYWQCGGVALRVIAGRIEPTMCICPFCDIPMEQGDHSECPVELLACPQHFEEQLLGTKYELGKSIFPGSNKDE